MGVTFTYNELNLDKLEPGRLGAPSEPLPHPYRSGFNVIPAKASRYVGTVEPRGLDSCFRRNDRAAATLLSKFLPFLQDLTLE